MKSKNWISGMLISQMNENRNKIYVNYDINDWGREFNLFFTLLPQFKFCSEPKFPLMGISILAKIMDSRLTNSLT